MHFRGQILWLACLIFRAEPSAAQGSPGTDYPCGKTNVTNSTTIFTDPSFFTTALRDSIVYPCSTYSGNIAIIPTINYNLADYGSSLNELNGSLLVNCTGVSTNIRSNSSDIDGLFTAFSYLSTATGSISIIGCSTIAILDLYTLTTLGGDLNIYGNPELELFLLYGLKSVNGSLSLHQEIPNPGDTASIDLTDLQTVGGDINITGPVFSLTETRDTSGAPNLTSVQGSVFINSTLQLDCSKWQQLNASGVIKGTFFCASALGNGTSSVSSVASLSPGAIAGIVIGCVAGFALFIVCCYFVAKSFYPNLPLVIPEAEAEGRPSALEVPAVDSENAIAGGVAELASKSNVPQMADVLGPFRGELSGTAQDGDSGRDPVRGELEGGPSARGSYRHAELSGLRGWDSYEMPVIYMD